MWELYAAIFILAFVCLPLAFIIVASVILGKWGVADDG